MKYLLSGTAMAAALFLGAPLQAQTEMDPMEHHHHQESAAVSVPGSGTARLPGNDGAMTGLHAMTGAWMLMAHGSAWGVYTDQGGPRGADRAFSQSMLMLSARGPVSDGVSLELRSMFSLDPLMGDRGYPILFATGETANGEALVDRQHPHDFVMELAARVDVSIGDDSSLFLYGGPVGEPAIGPAAFMHRKAARFNPEAPIAHHWFDSTHITFGVVTAGLATRNVQIEGSAFRGREPDEARWNIETPKLDSWSARLSWNPTPAWSAQVSYADIESPEALHADEDERRLTASLSHASGPFAATLGYSRKNRVPGPVLDAWLAEASYAPGERHVVFGRAELVENDELFPEESPLHGQAFRVGKLSAGYAYRIPLAGPVNLAVGGSVSVYRVPDSIRFAYGDTPTGFTLFARLALGD